MEIKNSPLNFEFILPDYELKRWFKPLKWRLEEKTGVLKIVAPTVFHRRHLQEHYREIILKAANEAGFKDVRLEAPAQNIGQARPEVVVQIAASTSLGADENWPQPTNPGQTFETFLIDDSNRLAALALKDLAEGHHFDASGLFLAVLGPWGKTHLLNALAFLLKDRSQPFLVINAAQFVEHGVENELNRFERRLRKNMIVIVDDVHLLAQNQRAQKLLRTFFDQALSGRAKIVASGPAPPAELEGLDDSLRSRLRGGLLTAIIRPEYELIAELGRRRAAELELCITEKIMATLIGDSNGDPRCLFGSLETLAFITKNTGRSVEEAALQIRPSTALGRKAAGVAIEDILKGTAASFGIKVSDLKAHTKTRQIAWPRRVAMYLAREMTNLTTTEIGAAMGGRDHSTVIHALKKIQEELQTPSQVQLVENIKRAILVKE